MTLCWSDTVEEIADAVAHYEDDLAREILEESCKLGRLGRQLVDDVIQKLADWDEQPHILRARDVLERGA